MKRVKAKEVLKQSQIASAKNYLILRNDINDFQNLLNDISKDSLSEKQRDEIIDFVTQFHDISAKDHSFGTENNLLLQNVKLNLKNDEPTIVMCKDENRLSFICFANMCNETFVFDPFGICNSDDSCINLQIREILGETQFVKQSTPMTKDCKHIKQAHALDQICKVVKLKQENNEIFVSKDFQLDENDNERFQDDLKKIMKEEYIGNIVHKTFNMENQTDMIAFKADLHEFIKNTCSVCEATKPLNLYINFLKSEVEKRELNPNYQMNDKEIEEKRSDFLNCAGFHRNKSFYSEESNENIDYTPIIFKKYPNEMKYINNFLGILQNFKSQLNYDEIFSKFCKYFEIDNKLFKEFIQCNNLGAENIENEGIQNLTHGTSQKIFEGENDMCLTQNQLMYNDTSIRTLEDILKIFHDENKHILQDEGYIKKLKHSIEEIKTLEEYWKSKNIRFIQSWAKEKRGYLKENDLVELIAVMNRAHELATNGQKLRITQILSVLVYFLPNGEKCNKICQIETGEGKTTIISLLACAKYMFGENYIDIITSNSVLAEDAVKVRKKFYYIFGMTVSHNNVQENEIYCYKCTVVYGAMSSFQFDYLRQSFEGMNTFGDRKFGAIILDEVDSLLIDNASNIAKLSSPFPGMDFLRYIYINIWVALNKGEKIVSEEILNNVYKKRGEILFKRGTDDWNESDELELEEFMKEENGKIYHMIAKFIKSSDVMKVPFLPRHLEDYCNRTLDKWIENAMHAKYSYNENEQYVIKKSEKERTIVPVDYSNTGVTLQNTVWSRGLHQFLQLKHNIRIRSETLTSSCISNVCYVQKYGTNVFGMTGTLGSIAEQDFLKNVYNVTFAKIPTFKEKLFTEYQCKIVEDKEKIIEVAMNAIRVAESGRAVLIICRTIADVNNFECYFESYLELNTESDARIKYYKDESYSKIVDETLDVGNIIVATNIAGRGADFKTTQTLNNVGGLHVIVTFCPENVRVKDQAFYRTARQGNQGSAQIIMCKTECEELDGIVDINSSLDINSYLSCTALKFCFLKYSKLEELKYQDYLFTKFLNLYTNERKHLKTASDSFYLLDLKEKWAFWFECQNFDNISFEENEAEDMFNKFLLIDQFENERTIVFNPFYAIQKAEYHLLNSDIVNAELEIDRSIKISKNPEVQCASHLKLFEIILEKQHPYQRKVAEALKTLIFLKYFEENEKKEWKNTAVIHLKNAMDALNLEIEFIKANFISTSDETKTELEFTNEENNSIVTNIEDNSQDKYLGDKHLDFLNILTVNEEGQENIFLQSINSRYSCLSYYQNIIKSMIRSIENSQENKSSTQDETTNNSETIPHFSQDCDIAIASRISKILCNEKFQFQNSENINKIDENDLSSIGIDTTYGLQPVHEVSATVIHSAQGHIVVGLGTLAGALAFPPAFPVLSNVASVLINEGITDIVMNLLSNGETPFDLKSYIKHKTITYATNIVTFGLSAILTCKKMLEFAINTCKKLINYLQKCTRFGFVVKLLEWTLTKCLKYLENLKYLKLFNIYNNVQKFDLYSKTSIFISSLCNISIKATQSIVTKIVMNKVISNLTRKSVYCFHDNISKRIKSQIENKCSNDLKKIKREDALKITREILYGKESGEFLQCCKEVIFGVLEEFTGSLNKFLNIGIKTLFNTYKIGEFALFFCNKLTVRMEHAVNINGNVDATDDEVNTVIKEISRMVATAICDQVCNITNEFSSMGTNMLMDKIVTKVTKSISCIIPENLPPPQEFLEVPENASDDEIKAACIKKINEAKNSDNPNKQLLIYLYQDAMKYLLKSEIENCNINSCVLDSLSVSLETNIDDLSGVTGIVSSQFGASITDAKKIMKKVHVEPVTTEINALSISSQFEIKSCFNNLNSDTCVLFMRNEEISDGHAVCVKQENGELHVHEKNADGEICKYAWEEYINQHNYKSATALIGKNFNALRIDTSEYITTHKNAYKDFKFAGLNASEETFRRKLLNDEFNKDKLCYAFKKIPFIVGGSKQVKISSEVLSELNERYEIYLKNGVTEKGFTPHILKVLANSNNSLPLCGSSEDGADTERMIGVFTITFKCGDNLKTDKIITISGDNVFSICQKYEKTPERYVKKEKVKLELNINGHKLYNIGKVEGNVWNFYTNEETNQSYTKSCAGQKAMKYISDVIKDNPKLSVQRIEMFETMWTAKGAERNRKYSKLKPAPPCDKCVDVLGAASGKE